MDGLLTEVLAAIEASALGQAARGGAWLYAIANTGHVLGVALLVGGIAVYDLILIRRGAAPETAAVAVPLALTGAVLAVATGVVLFAADATAVGRNWMFWWKTGLIALAVANAALFWIRPVWTRGQAAASLLFWLAAAAAGRMIAYV